MAGGGQLDSNASRVDSHANRQKRARSQLSCQPCRVAKLKCNREKACDQCIKRNRDSQCVYMPPAVKSKPAQNVKGRVRQLESLVMDLMNQQGKNVQAQGRDKAEGNTMTSTSSENGSSAVSQQAGSAMYSEPTPPSENDTSPDFGASQLNTGSPESGVDQPFGKMKISKEEISYHGADNWQAILHSISELKRELGNDDDAAEDTGPAVEPEVTMNSWRTVPMGGVQPHASTGLGFMLGNPNTVTREQLINAVPEKRVCDRLLSLWFNSPDPFKPIIHAPTFQNEYRRFWQAKNDTPTMWLGLLFAILSLAESFGLRDVEVDSPPAQACLERVNKYHDLSASAAVLADFTKPKEYTLECLIAYTAGLRSNNAFVNVWLMIGLIVRLALRMGYHRDSSHYPSITPFQGEMRRRVWAAISMIDVLISFQLGLPSMIRTIATDTESPRNLLDRDFSEDTKVLPPGRGLDELTPSSYSRAKLGIVKIFAQVCELGHSTVEADHDEVMRLDAELERARDAVPPLLRMPDISELVTDPAEQLMCRFNLDLLYLKTKTVLHRRYMLAPLAQLSPLERHRGIGRSRLICLQCSQQTLKHHHTIYMACQPGGQLESTRFYMGSISTHDFLLAAMVICMELSQQMNYDGMQALSNGLQCPRRMEMLRDLEQSQKIWQSTSKEGMTESLSPTSSEVFAKPEHMLSETEKASRAMAVMLDRVKKHFKSDPLRGDMVSCDAALADIEQDTRDGVMLSEGHVGIVSHHDWQGVPADFQLGAATSADGSVLTASDGVSQPKDFVTESVQPDSFNGVSTAAMDSSFMNGDYTAIADMLDGPMDWSTWDEQIMGSNGNAQQPIDMTGEPSALLPDVDMNTLLDTSKPPSAAVMPGNILYPQGTRPLDRGDMYDLSFNWQDLQDVDLDIRDYGTGGLWGQSPHWAKGT